MWKYSHMKRLIFLIIIEAYQTVLITYNVCVYRALYTSVTVNFTLAVSLHGFIQISVNQNNALQIPPTSVSPDMARSGMSLVSHSIHVSAKH